MDAKNKNMFMHQGCLGRYLYGHCNLLFTISREVARSPLSDRLYAQKQQLQLLGSRTLMVRRRKAIPWMPISQAMNEPSGIMYAVATFGPTYNNVASDLVEGNPFQATPVWLVRM